MCYGVHVGEYRVVQKESCYETVINEKKSFTPDISRQK